jgi:hypothetical protein
MTVGVLLSMSYLLIGRIFHEYMGALLLTQLIVHNVLNRKWYKKILSRRYNTSQIFQSSVNNLTLVAMLGTIVSLIIHSQQAFELVSISGFTALSRRLHLAAAYCEFALISMHLGLNLSKVLNLNIGRQQKISQSPSLGAKPWYFF